MASHPRSPAGPAAAPAAVAAARSPAVVAVLATALGPCHAAAADEGIVGLELRTTDEAFAASVGSRTGRTVLPAAGAAARSRALAHLAQLERELAEHFAGDREGFDVRPVLEGLAAWDRRVLEAVLSIPRGATASYADLAGRIGAPRAARAVGGAVGRNPVAVLVPCHRVVSSDGTLGGYGGSWTGSREEFLGLKERLLELEGVPVPPRSPARLSRRRAQVTVPRPGPAARGRGRSASPSRCG